MYSQEEYNRLYRLACAWSQGQEAVILQVGMPLSKRQVAQARRAGVSEVERVRIMAVDKVPMPEDPDLRAAALRTNILSTACRGLVLGHGVVVRADSWSDDEFIAHLFVHLSQFERSGGLDAFIEAFLSERLDAAGFGVGPLELEARRVSREIMTEARSS